MEVTQKMGAWKINVVTEAMPEEIASALGKLDNLVGASYKPIAYLGSQIVHGVNYAVLAEQTILCAGSTKNIVLIIFNVRQAPDAHPEVSLVSIQRVLEGSPMGTCGGVVIDPQVPVPEEAMKAFKSVMAGFVGSEVKPFALLATQVVKGVNYFLAAEVTPVYPGAATGIDMVVINDMCDTRKFSTIL